MSQAKFQKRMREKARQEKAAAKRARREERGAAAESTDEPEGATATVDQESVIAKLAKLHAQFDDEQIGFDEFEERKLELMAQLQVD